MDADFRSLLGALEHEQTNLQAELRDLAPDDWFRPTPAKGWDVRDTVAHLADTDEIAIDTSTGGPRPLNDFAAQLASAEDTTLWGVLRGRRTTGREVLAWWEDSSARERDARPVGARDAPAFPRHGAPDGDVGPRPRRAVRARPADRR